MRLKILQAVACMLATAQQTKPRDRHCSGADRGDRNLFRIQALERGSELKLHRHRFPAIPSGENEDSHIVWLYLAHRA